MHHKSALSMAWYRCSKAARLGTPIKLLDFAIRKTVWFQSFGRNQRKKQVPKTHGENNCGVLTLSMEKEPYNSTVTTSTAFPGAASGPTRAALHPAPPQTSGQLHHDLSSVNMFVKKPKKLTSHFTSLVKRLELLSKTQFSFVSFTLQRESVSLKKRFASTPAMAERSSSTEALPLVMTSVGNHHFVAVWRSKTRKKCHFDG